MMGPRAEKRRKEYLKIAISKAEREEKDQEQRYSNNWETTARDAQKLAKGQIQTPSCIDKGHSLAATVIAEEEKSILFNSLYNKEAITHWSEKLKGGSPDFPLTSNLLSTSRPFARSSAFTKDIIISSRTQN